METVSVRVVDEKDLAGEAAEDVARHAEEAVRERGRFSIALSGGSGPPPLYRLLADPDQPFRERIAWNRVHVFWGDERHVPPDHPESNFRLAHDNLLSKVPVPPANIHRVRAENPDAQRAADEYAWTLRSEFNLDGDEPPRFDYLLMGIGPDGHTASLFPGSAALRERERWVVAPWAEHLGAYRITFAPPVLNRARHTLFLVSGAKKAEAVRAALESDLPPETLPAKIVRPTDGTLLWLIDRPAARLLRIRSEFR